MNKKNLISSLSAVVSLAFLVAGCGQATPNKSEKPAVAGLNSTGYPIMKEKTTFKIITRKPNDVKPFDQMKFFKDLEQKTNIHIDWTIVPKETWGEKKSLLFMSGDLPDAIFGPWTITADDMSKYGPQGIITPINKLMDDYAPNVKKLMTKERLRIITAADGKLYSFPSIDESTSPLGQAIFINKKWLDTLEMQVPTTAQELYNALLAFKTKDPNGNGKADEIPMEFKARDGKNASLYSMVGLCNAFGIADLYHFDYVDDKLVYSAAMPQYKEMIKYFNRLYKEGLADKEAFTQSTQVLMSKLQAQNKGESTIGMFSCWSQTSILGTDKTDYVPLPPLKDPSGKQEIKPMLTYGVIAEGAFTITKACKTPEVLTRWIDEFYDPKTAIQANYGMFGINLTEGADGAITFNPVPEGKRAEEFRHSESPASLAPHALSKEVLAQFKIPQSPDDKEKFDLEKVYMPFATKGKVFFKNVPKTQEEIEKLSQYVDIAGYTDEMTDKWMLNGGVDEQWDAYVKKLEGMGLNDYVKLWDSILTRYYSVK